ncbi:hypothetical protein Q31a_48980 [Aureliella helgolandensis]|uniref:Uncharacterized protein n=1 Tax=Aureliella helgolandensis TaxID=2527968 RepID=A0A518GD49_9BACT|nr:hypothetical protein Q31a_48980 [Aureliella helgolandensis]
MLRFRIPELDFVAAWGVCHEGGRVSAKFASNRASNVPIQVVGSIDLVVPSGIEVHRF